MAAYTARMKSPHLNYVFFGKSRHWPGFSSENFFRVCFDSICLSSLVFHVSHIVGMSSKKKMRGIYAGRYVAVMQDIQIDWYDSNIQNPTSSVCLMLCAKHSKTPISMDVFSSAPHPTLIWLPSINLAPKSLLVRFGQLWDAFLRLIHGSYMFGFRVLSRVQRLMHSTFLPQFNQTHK